MSVTLTVHEKPTYLHVIVMGQNSRENVERYLEELLKECRARNCFRVLLEERLEGPRLGTIDVFEIVSNGTEGIPRPLQAVAFVDVNAKGDLMEFAETVAFNRGFLMKVFTTVAAAEKWLRDCEPDTKR
jgi:hypothetical protein